MRKSNKRRDGMFKSEKPEYIGEVLIYTNLFHFGEFYKKIPVHSVDVNNQLAPIWLRFTKEDITNEHDGFVEIFQEHHKEENIFYYDNIYDSFRNKIKKANIKKENKK